MNPKEDQYTEFDDVETITPFLSLQDLLHETCTNIMLQTLDDVADVGDFCLQNIQMFGVESPSNYDTMPHQVESPLGSVNNLDVSVSHRVKRPSETINNLEDSVSHRVESPSKSVNNLEDSIPHRVESSSMSVNYLEDSLSDQVESPSKSINNLEDSLSHQFESRSKSINNLEDTILHQAESPSKHDNLEYFVAHEFEFIPESESINNLEDSILNRVDRQSNSINNLEDSIPYQIESPLNSINNSEDSIPHRVGSSSKSVYNFEDSVSHQVESQKESDNLEYFVAHEFEFIPESDNLEDSFSPRVESTSTFDHDYCKIHISHFARESNLTTLSKNLNGKAEEDDLQRFHNQDIVLKAVMNSNRPIDSDKLNVSVPRRVEDPSTTDEYEHSVSHAPLVDSLSKPGQLEDPDSQVVVIADHNYYKFPASQTIAVSISTVLTKISERKAEKDALEKHNGKGKVVNDGGIKNAVSSHTVLKGITNTSEGIDSCVLSEKLISVPPKIIRLHRCDICVDYFKISNQGFYRCNLCEELFDDENEVAGHIKNMHRGNDHDNCMCIICDKIYTDEELADHAKTHIYKNFYTCDKCGKVFTATKCLISHEKIHEERKYQCDECGDFFAQPRFLAIHRRLVHKIIKVKDKTESFLCYICGRDFACRNFLSTHMYNHKRDRSHKCHICGQTFTTKSFLYSHLKTHAHDSLFVCDICGKILKNKNCLAMHKLNHTNDKPYKCDTCNKTFRRLSTFKNHERCHADFRPHICSICGDSFKRRHLLSDHRKKHETEKMYQCENCHKRYSTFDSFSMHLRIYCKQYPCDLCGAKFKNLTARQRHKLNVHNQKKDSGLCHICGKEIQDVGRMSEHLSIHTRKKNFTGKNTRKNNFTRKKDFECYVCGKEFFTESSARRHNKYTYRRKTV